MFTPVLATSTGSTIVTQCRQAQPYSRTIILAAWLLSASILPAPAQAPSVSEASEFGTGLVLEQPGDLASIPRTARFRNYLPAERDLSYLMPTPGHQGRQASCTAWAVAYAARTYHYAADHAASPSSAQNIASPAAVYNTIRRSDADCTRGTRIVDALNLLKSDGVPSHAEFGYSAEECRRLPSGQIMARAERFRIRDFQQVDVSRADDIKGHIVRGRPVVVSIIPDRSFKLYGGGVYVNPLTDEAEAHAIAVVGYSDHRQAFKVINSWGTRWGTGGYGWIGYSTFQAIVRNGFVMFTSTGSGPVTVPQPAIVSDVKPTPVVAPTPPSPTVVQITVPKPTPEAITPVHLATLPTELREALASFECAGLSQLDRSARRVRAYAGSADTLSLMKARMSALLPGYAIEAELRPWPQCEALQTFTEPLGASSGLTLRLAGKAAATAALRNGDPLIVEVTLPSFTSYLYLVYFQASGDAVHLVQPTGRVGRQHDPGARLVLGDGSNGGPRFTISQPFGDEMIVAVASASPLFETSQPISATERELLTEYRRAMLVRALGQGTRRIAAAALSLKTSP